MDITLDTLKKMKCHICGETNKTFANITLGQNHIATVSTCCNCGYTMTFAHSAEEYARYIEDKVFHYDTNICQNYDVCKNIKTCPRIKYGRKI